MISIAGKHFDEVVDDFFFGAFRSELWHLSQVVPELELGDAFDVCRTAVVKDILSHGPVVVENSDFPFTNGVCVKSCTLSENWSALC